MKKIGLLICIFFISILTGCRENNDNVELKENPLAHEVPVQVTTVSWKGIHYGRDFFDLYVTINEEDYYVGNFFGEHLLTYDHAIIEKPDNILTFFKGIWMGAGSDFYLLRKSETELAVMYYKLEYGADPADREWEDYIEVLVISIEKDIEIQIQEPTIIMEFINDGIPVG